MEGKYGVKVTLKNSGTRLFSACRFDARIAGVSVIRQWRGERVVCRTVALWFTCVGVGENYCINLHFPLENF